MLRGLSDSNCHPRCALGAAGRVTTRAECFPGVWQPRTTPGDSAGAPRGWLRIFAQILLISRCRRPKPGGGAPRPPKFPSGAPWVMCWLWMSLMAAPHPPAKCQSAQVCGKAVCYRKTCPKKHQKQPERRPVRKMAPAGVAPLQTTPGGPHGALSTGVVSHFALYLTYLSLPPSRENGEIFPWPVYSGSWLWVSAAVGPSGCK